MPRTNNIDLPDAKEVWQILAKESQRSSCRDDFLNKNPALFDAYRQLATRASADATWTNHFSHLDLEELIRRIEVSSRSISSFIQSHPEHSHLYDALFDSLARQDAPSASDAIFVFGSPSDARVHKAIQLYQDGFAPKIILSGRGPHYSVSDESEAERMARAAFSAGVPRSAVLIEPASVTLPDNVKRTIDMLEQIDWRPKKIIIIAATYILGRASMEWYKFAPWDVDIYAVSPDNLPPAFTKQGWHLQDTGVRTLLNEYSKIIIELRVDQLRRVNRR